MSTEAERLQEELAQFARDRADLYTRACKVAGVAGRWEEAAKWESSSHAVSEIAEAIEGWGKQEPEPHAHVWEAIGDGSFDVRCEGCGTTRRAPEIGSGQG